MCGVRAAPHGTATPPEGGGGEAADRLPGGEGTRPPTAVNALVEVCSATLSVSADNALHPRSCARRDVAIELNVDPTRDTQLVTRRYARVTHGSSVSHA